MKKDGEALRDDETITSVATAPGLGAVALVRISGPRAWEIAGRMVRDREKFESLEKRKNAVMDIVHPESGELLDKGLVVKYKAPASFTGEDVIEFQCHGGLAVSSAITAAAIDAGARQARAGEFTQKAFLNGKLDLAQAEAVDNLVKARTEAGRKVALEGLKGELGEKIGQLREYLVNIKAELEYTIDFPEEVEQIGDIEKRVREAKREAMELIEKMLEGSERKIVLTRGAVAVIAGVPNVGKSMLFNALLGKERSIVTEEAGTTRDAVEMEAVIRGYLFRLVDTAGLRESENSVERLGVEYSRKYIDKADLVLFVHEAGEDIRENEKRFLVKHGKKRTLRIINKVDLLEEKERLPEGYYHVSAKKGTGIGGIREEMVRMVFSGGDAGEGIAGVGVACIRQKNLLEQAGRIISGIDESRPLEIIAVDLDEVCRILEEITGKITSEDVLERIFGRFCIGK
ncbi:MAG: tRNA uridine-5-carboxymethylaminomethyl(34) synthesis GTPase MnmE [Gemmatimonadota bacterium]|nr:tRNA uridine-5-carboxymethylaminomethyl(34) synthesis GTPase MnmE [Gemmatimonadota bacterium]